MLDTQTENKGWFGQSWSLFILASTVGSGLEWYDFFISGVAASLAWPAVFFPTSSPVAAITLSIGVFGIGFLSRPIGGVLFSHYGDKLGRKSALLWTLATMGIFSLMIGIAPGYASLGALAPILLTIFRFFQGMGVGGEWGSVNTWVLENAAKSKRRGFWTSWANEGAAIGLLSSSSIFAYLSGTLSRPDFLNYGWRIPFFIGAIVALIGLVVRFKLLETPIFASLQKDQLTAKYPIVEVFRNEWKKVILFIVVLAGLAPPFYIGLTLTPSYLIHSGVSPSFAATTILLSGIVYFFSVMFLGSITDVVGRKRMFFISAAFLMVFSIPYWLLIQSGNLVLTAIAQIVYMNIGGATSVSVSGIFFPESFSARHRVSASNISYQSGSAIGGILPIVYAALIAYYNGLNNAWPYIAAITTGILCVSLVALWRIQESKGAILDHSVAIRS